ncbi:testis-specific serine/threonine-protein kinase 3-like [Chrysoperla carnea]|uniref:testis-specific serine/threonine-protein kinase 3-like n=1 Tax=Chrysoperla carnea TaxID=189513 RepID=UPI001D0627C4|nr:testis-specific serine/threonine-protein kinase 3-like [Chrysoperla carnea]
MVYIKDVPRSQYEDTASLESTALAAKGYHLIKEIGSGSYSKVFLSEYVPPNALVETARQVFACKIIDTNKVPKNFCKRFLPRELEIISQLKHPHIIHVWSIFRRKSKYYIFMRLAENGDLLDFILKFGALDERKARVWFRQLVSAVQYLHERNIAHRDLKCDNILITSNFNIKITDFGFARYVINMETGAKTLSETYCGSLAYAAPEVIRGEPYEPLTVDVWSMGIILFVMLSKVFPFNDKNIKRMYAEQMNRSFRFKVTIADTLSVGVKNLVNFILEPDLKKRLTIQQIAETEWIAGFQVDTKHHTIPKSKVVENNLVAGIFLSDSMESSKNIARR